MSTIAIAIVVGTRWQAVVPHSSGRRGISSGTKRCGTGAAIATSLDCSAATSRVVRPGIGTGVAFIVTTSIAIVVVGRRIGAVPPERRSLFKSVAEGGAFCEASAGRVGDWHWKVLLWHCFRDHLAPLAVGQTLSVPMAWGRALVRCCWLVVLDSIGSGTSFWSVLEL